MNSEKVSVTVEVVKGNFLFGIHVHKQLHLCFLISFTILKSKKNKKFYKKKFLTFCIKIWKFFFRR